MSGLTSNQAAATSSSAPANAVQNTTPGLSRYETRSRVSESARQGGRTALRSAKRLPTSDTTGWRLRSIGSRRETEATAGHLITIGAGGEAPPCRRRGYVIEADRNWNRLTEPSPGKH